MNIKDVFTPLYGKFCWNAEKGIGSFLTFQFGEPRLEISERDYLNNGIKEHLRRVQVYGSWYLWIYMCDWSITSHYQIIATQSSKAKVIHQAMSRLDGQKLVEVIANSDLSTSFFFELGDRIDTRPNREEYGHESEQWLLYKIPGNVFILRADGKYYYGPGMTKSGEENWEPLAHS